MRKILIGTHNKGKFNEIANLITKKIKKISPIMLKIPSPKETGKSFSSNSKLKANFSPSPEKPKTALPLVLVIEESRKKL